MGASKESREEKVSDLEINWSVDALQQGGAIEPPVVATTQRLLEVCGFQDGQAYKAALYGLVVSFVMFVWFGRIRQRWEKDKKLVKIIPFVDKALLVFVAMMFVTIIVNLLRAG